MSCCCLWRRYGPVEKKHAVPAANVLASYKGSDKNVLKIIEELKKPENNTLLANLNQQGEVDWQNYQAMLTSDFMQGLTLRFYQGPDSNYFDAQLNLETKDLRLLSKAQKRVEREQALEKLKTESKTKAKSTMGYNDYRCKTAVDFEYVLMEGPRTTIIDMTTPSFSYMVQQFISLVSSNLYYKGFAWDQNDYVKYINESPIVSEVYQREIYNPIKNSFDDALAHLQSIYRTSSGYFIFGFLRKISISSITCTTGDGDGGGTGGGTGGGFNAADPRELYQIETFADSISLKKKLDCFKNVPDNANTIYTAKICADLPDDDDPLALIGPDKVGHAFITLTKTNGNNTVTQTFGFYPQKGYKSILGNYVNSQIEDDGDTEHEYNASFTVNLDQLGFERMIRSAKTYSYKKYSIRYFNCANYALAVFNAGIDINNEISVPNWIPSTYNYYTTPSGLYKKIKEMKDAGKNGASVATKNASKSSNCN